MICIIFIFQVLDLYLGQLKDFRQHQEILQISTGLICYSTRDFLNAVFEHTHKAMINLKEELISMDDNTDFIIVEFK